MILRVARRSAVLLIALSFSSAPWATAQAQREVAGVESPRLTIRLQADGRLDVTATNAPIDEVIRAVAGAAGIQVSALGSAPHDLVTVAFTNAPPTRILWDLMDPVGISYVMTPGAPGRPGRLMMGSLESPGVDSRRGAASADRQPMAPSVELGLVAENTTVDAPQTPARAQASEPTEWPSEVQPVNFGPPAALPDTREGLFQMVNGGGPVSFQGGVTPNPAGPGRPGQIAPVNPMTSGLGFSAPGSSRPGALVGPGMSGPIGPIAPVDPSMLQAPHPIALPAPVVIQFPPPAAP